MEFRKQYEIGQIYQRKFEEKSYYKKQYEQVIPERLETIILTFYISNVYSPHPRVDFLPM